MLPATGLFHAINCPFFEKDMCTRPYCHFRHSKPEKLESPAAVTYSATPKIFLQQNREDDAEDKPAKKKTKLEYIPMPTLHKPPAIRPVYVPTTKPVEPAKSTYIPTKITKPEEAVAETKTILVYSPKPKPAEKKDEISYIPTKIPKSDFVEPVKRKETENHESTTKKKEEYNPTAKKKKLEYVPKTKSKSSLEATYVPSSKSSTSEPVEAESVAENIVEEKKIEEKIVKVAKERDKHKSSSSNSSHRSSSSSHKDKDKDRHKDKEKDNDKDKSKDKDKSRRHSSDKDKDKEKKKSSSSSKHDSNVSKTSSSTSHRHSSSSTSRKSSSRDDKKSSSSSRKTSSSKDDKKSTSSSTSSREKSSSSSKSKPKLEEEIYRDLIMNPPSDIDVDSDEDDVLEQCKLIFEEYQPATKKEPENGNANSTACTSNVELIDIFVDKVYDDAKKKRVAYEGAKPVKEPPVKKKNHVQSAMQSIYLRQEQVRKKQEEIAKIKVEEEAAAAAAKKKVEEDAARKKAEHPPVAAKPQTPEEVKNNGIHAASFYSRSPEYCPFAPPPRSRFSPAANVLAFQRAKEKIDELRRAKTPAQTASKAVTRVAHVNPDLLKPEKAIERAAPPVLEQTSTKISYNIRMQYYNMMVKHCINIYPNCEDAWDRAQTEELAVFKKCNTPMIYKSSALLSINKLRKEALDSGNTVTEKNSTISHELILAGKMGLQTTWSVNKKLKSDNKSSCFNIDTAPSTKAYKMIYECILTEEQLKENGYPRPGDGPGKAKLYKSKPRKPPKEDERYCSRCSKIFNLDMYDEIAVDSCNYHGKGTGYRRGFADNLHRCCQQPAGTPGCMYGNYHVSDWMDLDNLTGFVKTIAPPDKYVPSKKDVFALDCEMCYTTAGLELTRITVVDVNEKTVYDSLVKPDNMIVDYNTTYSGITEQMLANTTTTLMNVQAVLLSMFNSETVLIGHSLDSDLKALKLIHDVVVDTSVLYPHKMGPPKKRALKNLCIENLKKIIQENEAGHDSAEDAVVCIQLIKHYLRNRII